MMISLYLKTPKSTLYKLRQEGQILGQDFGRHWRFGRDVIDRWLDRGSIDSATKIKGDR